MTTTPAATPRCSPTTGPTWSSSSPSSPRHEAKGRDTRPFHLSFSFLEEERSDSERGSRTFLPKFAVERLSLCRGPDTPIRPHRNQHSRSACSLRTPYGSDPARRELRKGRHAYSGPRSSGGTLSADLLKDRPASGARFRICRHARPALRAFEPELRLAGGFGSRRSRGPRRSWKRRRPKSPGLTAPPDRHDHDTDGGRNPCNRHPNQCDRGPFEAS